MKGNQWFNSWRLTVLTILLHTAIILSIYAAISLRTDDERVRLWHYVWLSDYPVVEIYHRFDGGHYDFRLVRLSLIVGGMQWAVAGIVLDGLRHVFQRKHI